jgi:hypothetical protein
VIVLVIESTLWVRSTAVLYARVQYSTMSEEVSEQ